MSTRDANTRMFIHRRFVVRFLLVLLVLLSAASFISIALGLGLNTSDGGQEESGTPTKLTDMSPFYVLLIGSDSLEGTALYTGGDNSNQQADGLLLARIDPANCVLTLVTVPSNTVIEDFDGMVRDSLSGGPQQTVHMVERVAGVNIRYYFLMDFSGFETLLGRVGRVKADVPVSITMQDPITAKQVTVPSGKGVELDEAATLAYLRATDPYLADADPHRQLNVRSVISDMVFTVLGLEDDGVRKALGVFEEEVDTNITNSLLISLVTRFYDERENVKVYACTGPYLASAVNAQGEPIVTNQVSAWRSLMSVVDSGEDPAAAMPQYDFKGSDDDYVKAATSASASAASSSRAQAASTSSAKSADASKASSSADKG